jgi:hypothetical protein
MPIFIRGVKSGRRSGRNFSAEFRKPAVRAAGEISWHGSPEFSRELAARRVEAVAALDVSVPCLAVCARAGLQTCDPGRGPPSPRTPLRGHPTVCSMARTMAPSVARRRPRERRRLPAPCPGVRTATAVPARPMPGRIARSGRPVKRVVSDEPRARAELGVHACAAETRRSRTDRATRGRLAAGEAVDLPSAAPATDRDARLRDPADGPNPAPGHQRSYRTTSAIGLRRSGPNERAARPTGIITPMVM